MGHIEFKKRLLECMAHSDFNNQYKIAKAMGLEANTVNNWFSSKKTSIPSDRYLSQLAKIFNVTMGWLRYGEESSRPTISSRAQALVAEIEQCGEEALIVCRDMLRQYIKMKAQAQGGSQDRGHTAISTHEQPQKKKKKKNPEGPIAA